MEATLYNEESLVRYLLGQLSTEEQNRIEAKYFDDKDCFEQLQVVEGELIDSYVYGRLSEKDREAFESRFLQVAERRERIEFAQAWKVFVENRRAAQVKNEPLSFFEGFLKLIRYKPLIVIPFAAAMLLLLGSAWLVFENVRLKDRLELAQTSAGEIAGREQELKDKLNQERQLAEQLAKDLETERLKHTTPNPSDTAPPNSLGEIITLILSADMVRGGGENARLELFANTRTVRLAMVFANDDYKNVNATIKKVGGTGVLQQAELKAQARGSRAQAVWSLPAKPLDEGDYIVTLNAVEESGAIVEIDRYAFRVVKK